jgi:dTDP-4-dehydrorhamnose reductase
MHLLVTGASGLLGLNLSCVAAEAGLDVTGLVNTRPLVNTPFDVVQTNLLDIDNNLSQIEALQPDGIIHCAAIANLNVAEKHPELAYQLNAEVPGRLAAATKRWGIPFIHIFTDAVFDGEKGNYQESDPTNPLSVYARTKLAGEQTVQDANPDAVIARVVFFGWSLSGQRSLSEFFFNNLGAGKVVNGYTDTLFSPLYVDDLANLLLEMLETKLTGLYHVVSPESISKYSFGVRIADKFGFDSRLITPIEAKSLDRGAQRSLNLTLNCDKLEKAVDHQLPTVTEGIEAFYQGWLACYPQKLQGFRSKEAE